MGTLENTVGQYRSLRMSALADNLATLVATADENELSYLSFAQLLAETELKQRDDDRVRRYLRAAKLPVQKHLEDFDYRHQTTISKREVNALLDFQFVDQRENLIFIGPAGVGKTHLALGIGLKAIQAGYKVLFKTALGLVEELELAESRGELKKKLNQLGKFDVLIIDELGYLPMKRSARYNLFQLINSLYEFRSIILTTNKDFTAWGEFFHEDNVAVPIIDRVIHHSHIFMLGGESYRLRSKAAEKSI